jgi:hypothetical protein
MATKFFVLAGVAVLAGVFGAVGGCSSDPEETPVETDAGSDTGTRPTPREASVDPPVDSGPVVCPTTTEIAVADLPLQWKPPPATQNVCTQQHIDDLKAAFKASSSVKYADMKTLLGVDCSGCVFSPIATDGGTAAATWSVFVEASSTGAYDNRTASCFARLKNDNCGKTRFQFEQCLRAACPLTDCGTDAKVRTCFGESQKAACKAITTEYVAACPEEADMLPKCNIYASIAASCSVGADGGIDASAP